MESWVGKRLGKVQIESLVGRGGAAEVYLGTHTTLGRKVAVKILRHLSDEHSDALDRFEREARAVAKLRHSNIVQVHDFDTIDGNPYLVMEYIDGPSLSKYVRALHQNKGRLPLDQVVQLIRAVASALQYAHNNRVIHRDVKPGNILLTSPSRLIEVGKPLPEDFEPVLTDFGLVRFMDSHRQTTTGHIAGTPAYMSPEQSRGEASDGRADVYSLGVVLYELLSGDVPFDGESTVSILLKQVTEPPPPIPGLSPLVQNVIDRALAKDVRNRFQTPLEFANALSAAAAGETKDYAPTLQFDAATLDLPPADLPLAKTEEPERVEQPLKRSTRWVPIVLLSVTAVALGSFFVVNGLPSSPTKDATPTPSSASLLATDTLIPVASTSTYTATPPSGPIGIVRFQNGSAIADQISVITQSMPAPPPGGQYELWLLGGDERISIGAFIPDSNGRIEFAYSDPDGANLISRFDKFEITFEPSGDTDPESSGLIAYSFTLPEEGMMHVRYLLSAFSATPNDNALMQGLYANIKQIAELAKEMQTAFEGGDQASVRQKAETALNLIVGAKSADYKDWNGDGKIEPRDSYGLLFSGSEVGYIQAVLTETGVTMTTADATEYMLANGEVVTTCTQNLSHWTPDLRALLLTILNSTSEAETSESIRALVTLTDQMLNGIDADNNGKV
ncbi:MAG TPA: protein kinase, partial [Anaerolineales bacterium]|nr:protein kinase [Anaerolineales bacterium]